ncbi:MAG: TIGR04211 family SH3 domain-containing protein [Pseudomonadota bacterium]
MKLLNVMCLCLLAWLVLAGAAGAERVMYVSDRMQITVRSEPTGDARVIEMIASGEQASVLEDNNEGWLKVRTHSGKEGWVLKRHMVADKPAAVLLKEMAPQDKTVAQRMEDLRRELAESKKTLAQAEGRAQESGSSLAKLQGECAEVIKLREEHTRLLEDCQQKAAALDELTTENESLRFGTNIKWFLAGGGVLLLGWILGAAFSRRKRRWSSNLD